MPRGEAIRAEVQRLLRAVPFRPFVLNMENGAQVIIAHPENIAFVPTTPEGSGGSEDFYVLSNQLRLFSTFGAVTNVVMIDQGEPAA